MAKLTVHLRDKATDTYVEVGGERINASAVQFTGEPGKLSNVTLFLSDVEVIDERSGAPSEPPPPRQPLEPEVHPSDRGLNNPFGVRS